jgi:hypothetical protein
LLCHAWDESAVSLLGDIEERLAILTALIHSILITLIPHNVKPHTVTRCEQSAGDLPSPASIPAPSRRRGSAAAARAAAAAAGGRGAAGAGVHDVQG